MSRPKKNDGAMPDLKSKKFDFACTRCGNCCRGEPGFVWVSQADVRRMADHLEMDVESYYERYVRVVGRRLSLTEFANGDCVMWDKEVGCTVYPVRPKQCVTFPYWKEVLDNEDLLRDVARGCPGIQLKTVKP